MESRLVKCGHCGTDNVVGLCSECGRSFVITTAHLQLLDRKFAAEAVGALPPNFQIPTCDFCTFQARGDSFKAMTGALRQRTCPACKTEVLTSEEP
jgi:hypothetical protein